MEFPSLTTWFIPTLEGKNNTTGLAGGGGGGIHFPDTSREISDNVECYISTNIQTLSRFHKIIFNDCSAISRPPLGSCSLLTESRWNGPTADLLGPKRFTEGCLGSLRSRATSFLTKSASGFPYFGDGHGVEGLRSVFFASRERLFGLIETSTPWAAESSYMSTWLVCELDLAAALQPMNLSFFFISTIFQRLSLLLGNHANLCAGKTSTTAFLVLFPSLSFFHNVTWTLILIR